MNERTENIGARRLHTVMEKLLEDISFTAPEMARTGDHHHRGLRPGTAGESDRRRGLEQVYFVERAVRNMRSGVMEASAKTEFQTASCL